ncbi:PEP/pyruvate-binding domain-containing protein [Nonomuraea longicatena]|uniref:Phosphoenolpyruvate synthase n=1 Tax=Nonomuraea longicatena TaxID=83682 RepID=A0ABN1PL98_9ACTN
MTLVAPLRDFGRRDLDRAGGKGANLGELLRLGLPVPDGFVVTTAAYGLVASATEIADVELPAELRKELVGAYERLGGGPVAVRSSATAEDLPSAAFAGQQDTFLNVVGERQLLDAVRRCWASLFTARAVAYRARRGIADDGVAIAVVVQSMVEAEIAGVLFTANPVTGARDEFVADASSGLGEAVVSGLVTPDHYVLDREGRPLHYRAGRREVVVRSVEGGGTREERPDGPGGPRLPAWALRELTALGARVAAHFGRPMDLEWAYAAGRVSLLQARPMTALPPPPLTRRLNAAQRRIGGVLLEYMPVRPYPIDMSSWLPYGPAGLMGEVADRMVGIRASFEEAIEEQDGVAYRMVPPTIRPTRRLLTLPVRLLRKARTYDPAAWTRDPRFSDYLTRVERMRAADLASLRWPELKAVPRQVLDLVRVVADLRVDYLPGSALAVVELHAGLRLYGLGGHASALVAGARTRTEDTNRELAALARRLDEPGFEAAFARFLDEYGHRETISPVLVSAPGWGDDPETVRGLLKVLADGDERPEEPDPLASLLRHPRLRPPRRRARIRRLVAKARAGFAFREDSHFYFTMPQPLLRRALLEMGGRLGLREREDVFHLRLEELERIKDPDSEATGERLRSIVSARAAKREELEGVRMIDPRAVFPAPDPGDALVAGTPASPGRVSGPVRVILGPADFGRLEPGDVLVCPYTNPAWTPLFQRACAVVVDTGGPGSHAAIVAREYGIPAVMGTCGGTAVLTDGQRVVVDGDLGRVSGSP